jgi:hypothetical protein
MRRLFCAFVFAVCWTTLFVGTSRADAFTYTFESPNFTLGSTIPLLNVAPNIGASTFRTSFTDTVDANGYQITNLQQNGLISGQSLFAPTATSALTLTFNTPVTQLSLVFAINTSTSSLGFLRLVTPSGTFNQASSNVGGGNGFPGGTLTFTTAVPFATATLQGFTSGGTTNTQIDIDNLTLTTPAAAVPEPSTLALLGLGMSALVGWRCKKKA